MCQMVRYEVKFLPQRTSKNLFGDTAHLTEPQQEGFLKPRIHPPLGAKSRSAQFRVERVCHVIDIAGGEPGVIQAETDRALGKLMRLSTAGNLPCLMRLNRSSSTATTSLPSTRSAAAES